VELSFAGTQEGIGEVDEVRYRQRGLNDLRMMPLSPLELVHIARSSDGPTRLPESAQATYLVSTSFTADQKFSA
jgi:hypothetical protein